MILSDIKRYLQAREQSTLADMALHFDVSDDALEGMLEQWVRKGRVSREKLTASCGSSCNKCGQAATEIYRWLDK